MWLKSPGITNWVFAQIISLDVFNSEKLGVDNSKMAMCLEYTGTGGNKFIEMNRDGCIIRLDCPPGAKYQMMYNR